MLNPTHIKMNIKEFTNKIIDFTIKRAVELLGIFLIIVSILLITSLFSYSPDDPNFIFMNNTNISKSIGNF